MNKLLTDPVFRVETPEGPARLNLPALLAALGEDQVDSLLGLQHHQEDAFHIFLCYLAGAVLARNGRTEPAQDEAFWREGLLILADGNENAWNLVVDDPTQPAFMQARVPDKADFAAFKLKAMTPDDIDVLPTAKNHDVKSSRAVIPNPDDWIYALVSLQTMSGFFGQGNYGVVRMNGGFGSRPRIEWVQSYRWGALFKADLARLLAERVRLLEGPWGYKPDGLALTWTRSWDLTSSLSLSSLDPFFIEIARGIRLKKEKGAIRALGKPSKSARIAAKELSGVVGDPWVPINQKNQTALTISSRGFTPEILRNLVFADGFKLEAMQRPAIGHERESGTLFASVLVRGQGTTDGFHQALIRIPGRSAGALFRPGPERDQLAERSKEWLGRAGEMQNRVLKTALYSLLEAGPEKINFDKREVSAWVDQAVRHYAETWARDFFPWLWRSLDQDDEAARQDWLEHLQDLAWNALQDAIDRLPIRTGRSYRSRVRAEGTFYGCLCHHFPLLKKNNAHDDSDQRRP